MHDMTLDPRAATTAMWLVYLVEDHDGRRVETTHDVVLRDQPGLKVTFLGSHPEQSRAAAMAAQFRLRMAMARA